MKSGLVVATALFLLIILPAGCGGGGGESPPPESPPPQSPAPAEDRDAPARPAGDGAEFEELSAADESDPADTRLAEVKLLPERIRFDSAVRVTVVTRPREAPGTSLVIAFWINDRKAKESADPNLPADQLRKGDGVFADVILLAGEVEVDRRRTDLVLVENSDPVIEAVEFPEIKGPGDYVITVKAADPDEDELTYELDGVNIPDWLRLGENGRILLNPGDNPPEVLEFEVVVRDDDGGEARRSVTLTFKPPPAAGEEETAPEET